MRPLAGLEQFFERLFERPSARLFRTRLQPVQLQRRIERAMEAGRRSSGGRAAVPDRYVLRLHPDDLAAFDPIAPALIAELADAALSFARRHRYLLASRPIVALAADARVKAGEVGVDVRFEDRAVDASPDDGTMVYAVPSVLAPRASLREIRRDGSSRTIELDGTVVTIGRAPDNAIVVPDEKVSRQHARIQPRRGAFVLTDLGSTNGTWVGGVRIDEVVLGEGDRIEVGDTAFFVESVLG